METITRKSMLYPTKVEYGDYALNHVLGCAHGCKYPCYAYISAKRFNRVRNMKEWRHPKLVSNTISLLNRELQIKRKRPIKNVHLCFSTDPYMEGYPQVATLSTQVIEKLNSAKIPVTVLTKGRLPEKLATLSPQNMYGITLVSLSPIFKDRYEPNTANVWDRLNHLKLLHDQGCQTWVSIEPYPTPNIAAQSLTDILREVRFVDRIVFGRINYSSQANTFTDAGKFYNRCINQLNYFSKQNNIELVVKQNTKI